MEDQWLAWSKRLHAIASTGIHFGTDPFDQERYEEVADIARAMMATLGEVPIERISDLFPSFAGGYATPTIDVRGALFRANRVLLVRERSDGLWTLPGGYADVGLSAAENVAKEVLEEANLQVTVRKLVCVRHKAKHAYRPDARDFYKFFFLCECLDDALPQAGLETVEVGFFGTDALPELSSGRTIAADIELAWQHYQQPALATVFD